MTVLFSSIPPCKARFRQYLCRAQSKTPKGTFPLSNEEKLAELYLMVQDTSDEGKAVVGHEILDTIQKHNSRRGLVDIAQRLAMLCKMFSIGVILYLVDVVDQENK